MEHSYTSTGDHGHAWEAELVVESLGEGGGGGGGGGTTGQQKTPFNHSQYCPN